MNFLSLKKYDDFILSKFESKKLRYFFLMLPQRLLGVFLICLLVITKFISLGFVLFLLLGFIILNINPFKQNKSSH